jgi:hypothetical protein
MISSLKLCFTKLYSLQPHRELVLDKLAQSLPQEAFTEIQLELDKPKILWVVTKEVEISALTNWKGQYYYRHQRFDFLSSH